MKRQRSESINVNGEPKKIVLFGEGSIGKSTLFHKLNNLTDLDYQFPKTYKATDNFDLGRLRLATNIGIVQVDLWDTAGQETRGGLIRDAYLKGADGVLLLYDLSNSDTVSNLSQWLDQIRKITPNIPVAVLGNKSDKYDDLQQRTMVKLRVKNLSKDIGHKSIDNFLISIKEDTHIDPTSGKEKPGCLVGLEFILTKLFNQTIKL